MTITFDKQIIFNNVSTNIHTLLNLAVTQTGGDSGNLKDMTLEDYNKFIDIYGDAIMDITIMLSHLKLSSVESLNITTLTFIQSAKIQEVLLPQLIEKYIIKYIEQRWFEYVGYSIKTELSPIKIELRSMALRSDKPIKRLFTF